MDWWTGCSSWRRLGRYPRFLGKSTLFRIVALVALLEAGRGDSGVPGHRRGRGDHNVSAFAASRQILSCDGVVAIFPEGISHDEASLQPLRTGAARIALEAAVERASRTW